MSSDRSFIEELSHRRVPQLVGVYVGATWLMIELGDWMTERFNLPPNLTSYVFVAMLVMLPAMVMFAYNHGAPGKDQWTATERYFIPFNALIAVVALYVLSPRLTVEAATETVQLTDETGVVQEFEIPVQGFHEEVTAFFWENTGTNSDDDWLAYGLPLMLAHDLNRISPVLTVNTPFESRRMRWALRNRGYDRMRGAPRGLLAEIARERRSPTLIVGEYSDDGIEKKATVTLITAESGETVAEHQFTGDDWFTAIDDISVAVQQYLGVQPADNQSDEPVSQHLSESLEAIRHYSVGRAAGNIDNDFALTIQELEAAKSLDPGFAEAIGRLSRAYYGTGDTASAQANVADALRNSYRLSESSKFELRAHRYVYEGDYERARRTLELWTQVQPNSTEALAELAGMDRLLGTPEGLDNAVAAYDRMLELDPNDIDILREKAEVETQRGNHEAAIALLTNFLDLEPDNADVMNEIADIHQAQGDLDRAQAMLEDAALLSDNPLESELGLARLEARRGLYVEAERRLAALLSDGQSPAERVQVLSAQVEVAMVRGHISRTLELHAATSEIAKTMMPPVVHLISMENQRASILSMVGKTEEALAWADQITAQLQPPISDYMNFTYAGIYAAAKDRENFAVWAEKNQAIKDQLPDIFAPMLEMEAARLSLWNDDSEAALLHIDTATELFESSFLQTFRNNLSIASMSVGVAELYLDAGELDKAEAHLGKVFTVFPANAYGKLVAGKVELARGNVDQAKAMLMEAMEIWADADDDYIHRIDALEILEST